MNVLSLFDGISCGQIALERAGIKVKNYYASEIDKYAISVTQNNYPDTIQLGDVTKINIEKLPKIDLLIGGSPCQDLSIMKKNRDGICGEKSMLFFKYIDILREIKPKYFLFENVGSMSDVDKGVISGLFEYEPISINSYLVSATMRNRLYWTNIPYYKKPENKYIYLQNILEYVA